MAARFQGGVTPLLLAALHAIQAAGHQVNDVRRLDRQGEFTHVSVTWAGDTGMTSCREGFDHYEEALAWRLLVALVAHGSAVTDPTPPHGIPRPDLADIGEVD